MRTLIVMKGAPGTGKSTTIRELGLHTYTLSSDAIRLLYSSPRLNKLGNFVISAHNDKQVWEDYYIILERRMREGELIVVDATHTQTKEFAKYKGLSERYRYRIACIDFSNMPIDRVHRQNEGRPLHQIVPREAVQRLYDRCASTEVPKSWTVFPWNEQNTHIEDIRSWLKTKPLDLSAYKKIHHIGDVQGCATPLRTYLPKDLPDDEFFIFVGDICDRGPENGAVLLWLMKLIHRPNVRVLYGNHEEHLENWMHHISPTSQEVEQRSIPQWIESGIKPSDLGPFVARLHDIFVYQYKEKHVIVTHAGISTVPDYFERLTASTCHKGVGSYSLDIDEVFSSQAPDGWFQVHGHRNSSLLDIDACPKSFNLEGMVEFGGDLRILTLDAHGFVPIYIPNPMYRTFSQRIALGDWRAQKIIEPSWLSPKPHTLSPEILTRLEEHSFINKKSTARHPEIRAYNFTRDAFVRSTWDDLSIRARGLFIHQPTREIVARSYDKFFNIGEKIDTSIDSLQKTLSFPVDVFAKENGFLGILGYNREEDTLFFASKSTPEGPYSECFRRIFEDTMTISAQKYIMRYLKETHSSMVFEVVDPQFDPHIIAYEHAQIILLDVIKRTMTCTQLPYKKLCSLAKVLSVPHKERAYTFTHWNDFQRWYQSTLSDQYTYKGNHIEGFVIQDSNSYMVKIKLAYYQFWKSMRSLKDKVRQIRDTDKPLKKDISDPIARDFYTWCTQCPKEILKEDIISLRNRYESGWKGTYIAPSKPSPDIVGFMQALENLAAKSYIKQETADNLLQKAKHNTQMMSILMTHTIFSTLIESASPETKEKWNTKTPP